jgi:hypothetical protein
MKVSEQQVNVYLKGYCYSGLLIFGSCDVVAAPIDKLSSSL